MVRKPIYFVKKAIEAEALLIWAKELALFISDCIFNATVIFFAGRDQRGLSKLLHQKTNAFQGPT